MVIIMNWDEILQICKNDTNYQKQAFRIGVKNIYDEIDGIKFADGFIRINDVFKISHVYKIQLHGNMLWINDDDIIIALKDINKFKII